MKLFEREWAKSWGIVIALILALFVAAPAKATGYGYGVSAFGTYPVVQTYALPPVGVAAYGSYGYNYGYPLPFGYYAAPAIAQPAYALPNVAFQAAEPTVAYQAPIQQAVPVFGVPAFTTTFGTAPVYQAPAFATYGVSYGVPFAAFGVKSYSFGVGNGYNRGFGVGVHGFNRGFGAGVHHDFNRNVGNFRATPTLGLFGRIQAQRNFNQGFRQGVNQANFNRGFQRGFNAARR